MKFLLSILLTFNMLTHLEAQIKYEKEYRLDSDEVPEGALEFVEELNFTKKVKWYKEEGYNRESIEAKTKHFSCHYSVEFDLNGQVEDIEIVVDKHDLPLHVIDKMDEYLSSEYEKSRICKIQVQYSGKPESLIQLIANQSFDKLSDITVKYELEIKARKDNKFQKFEYLFNDQGMIINKALIQVKNTDNLEY